MSLTLVNDFAGGTSGTTVTTGNSGGASGNAFDAVNGVGSGATVAFDSTHLLSGRTMSLKMASTSGGSLACVKWTASLGSGASPAFGRIYVYLTDLPTGTAVWRLASFENGSANCSALDINSSGNIVFRDSTGASALTSATALPLNQWVRLEFTTVFSATSGQVGYRIFVTNPDGTTADEAATSSSSYNTNAVPTTLNIGTVTTTTGWGPHWYGDVGYSDTTWLGPSAVPNTVTVTNPGSQSDAVGHAVSLQVTATDSAPGQTLTFSATGLPPGLSISATGTIVSGTPTDPGSGYAWLSMYPGGGNTDPTAVEGSNMLNEQLPAWYRYYKLDQAVPTSKDAGFVAAGRMLVMSLEPPTGSSWSAVSSGSYDTYLASIGEGIADLASPCIVVFGHEMEGSAWSSYGTAAQFVAAFQHVSNKLKAQAGDNVQMAWVIGTPPASSGYASLAAYYPGDSYVTWVGADPYDKTGTSTPTAVYTSFINFLNANVLNPAGGYKSGGTGGAGKLKGIFETGVDNTVADATEAAWIRGVPAALTSLDIRYWSWFNDSGTLGNTAITPGSQSASALASIARNAVFNPVPAVAGPGGLISGTPTTSGTYTVTVTARDTTGVAGTATFTMTVAGTGNTVTVTSPGPQTSTVGQAITGLQVVASDSATGQTLTFSATGLPAGLAISSSGLITGTPSSAGTGTVKVTVTDTTSASGSVSFAWAVASEVVTVANPGNQANLIGDVVSLTVAASDSVSGQTLTFTASGLPDGLSISSSGVISGTVTSGGITRAVVTATDGLGASGSASFLWTLSSPQGPPFPDSDLDLRAELGFGGDWTDVSEFVFQDTTSITRGHPDESTTTTASTFTATLDNSDARFTASNPNGPYYGSLGLNTPIRVSIPEGATYLRLEGDQSSYASTPSATALNPTGDFEVWIDVTLDNPQGQQILAAKWAQSTNECSWALFWQEGGRIDFALSTNGTGVQAWALSPMVSAPPSRRVSVRMSYAHSTGIVTYYLGQELANWVEVGTVQMTFLGAAFASTTPITLGYCPDSQFGDLGLNGKIHGFALFNALNPSGTSSAVANPDFTILTAGATSIPDAAGNTWSLAGTAEVSDRNYQFHGQVSAWPQQGTPQGANPKVSLSASGLLRQYGQSNAATNSAMYRAYTRVSGTAAPLAYWPCEDGVNATQIASGIGGLPMILTGANPGMAAATPFACSDAIPTLGTSSTSGVTGQGSVWIGKLVRQVGSAALLRFLMAVPSGGDWTGVPVASMYLSGKVARVDLVYTQTVGGTSPDGSFTLIGYDTGNNQLFSTVATNFGLNGALCQVSMELQNSGSDLQYNIVVNKVGGSGPSEPPNEPFTYTGFNVGAVWQVVINPSGNMSTTAIGHISVQNEWTQLSMMQAPLNAWQGETAGNRFMRLCGEEGLQFRGLGDLGDTPAMGVQTIETVSTLLQECTDVDRGNWFEPRQCLGFGYRTRVSMGNQAPAFVLDFDQDQLGDDLGPTLDDQTVKNDVTITAQIDGSSARAVLDDGSAMAVGTVGRYDTEITLNVAEDSQLADEAGWYLHMSTVNEPRYTKVSVDLADRALGDFWDAILAAELGDRIQVVNPPAWLPPGLIDQITQGVTVTLSRTALSLAWNTVPASPWNVAYASDPVYAQADTDGSTLELQATPTQTSLYVVSAEEPWDSTACPFDVLISGERVTVADIQGPPQNFLTGSGATFAAGGSGNWTNAGGCSAAVSPSGPAAGFGSYVLTATNGSGNMSAASFGAAQILTEGLACLAGDQIDVSAWLYAFTVARSVSVGAAFYNASGGSLSAVTMPSVSDAVGVWSKIGGSVVAPASSAFCRLWVSVLSVGSVGEQHALALPYLADGASASGPQTLVAVRSVNGVSKTLLPGSEVSLFYPSIASM